MLTAHGAAAKIPFKLIMDDPPFRSRPPADLHFDYEKTVEIFKLLADIRFKLLALVPTIVGAAIALIGGERPPGVMIGVGALGLCATFGVLLYELRNSELYNQAIHRAKYLEGLQQFPESVLEEGEESKRWPLNGGVFSERHPNTYPVFGGIAVQHDIGLAFVYSAAVAGWVYLIAQGLAAAILVGPQSRLPVALSLAAAVGIITWGEIVLHDRHQWKPVRPKEQPEPTEPQEPKPIESKWMTRGRAGFIAAVFLVAGIVLAMLVPSEIRSGTPLVNQQAIVNSTPNQPQSNPEKENRTPEGDTTGSPVYRAISWPVWAAIGITLFTGISGLVAVISGKGGTRIAGAAVATAGFSAASILGGVHFKIEDLFKLNGSLTASLNRTGAQPPTLVAQLRGFDPGKIDLSGSMNSELNKVCSAWREHRNSDGGLLMLIGSTDRTPLSPQAQQRYESNAGLARSRAERVKDEIRQTCGVPADQMFAMITGPAYTPELGQGDPPRKGALEDRRVDVWAYWKSVFKSAQVSLGKAADGEHKR